MIIILGWFPLGSPLFFGNGEKNAGLQRLKTCIHAPSSPKKKNGEKLPKKKTKKKTKNKQPDPG